MLPGWTQTPTLKQSSRPTLRKWLGFQVHIATPMIVFLIFQLLQVGLRAAIILPHRPCATDNKGPIHTGPKVSVAPWELCKALIQKVAHRK